MNFEPWAHPHDADDPGLRDYLPRPGARPARVAVPAWVIVAIFLLGLLLGVGVGFAAAAPAPVALVVRPQILLQRSDVRVEARVPADARNRLLAIAWTSDVGTECSTQRAIAGEDGPVLHVLTLMSQPAANYLFVATLFDAGGHPRGSAQARILAPDSTRPSAETRHP